MVLIFRGSRFELQRIEVWVCQKHSKNYGLVTFLVQSGSYTQTLKTPITQMLALVIEIINLLTKSPKPQILNSTGRTFP